MEEFRPDIADPPRRDHGDGHATARRRSAGTDGRVVAIRGGIVDVSFLLTVFRDLTEAIIVGFALGSVPFIHRMSKTTAIALHAPFVPDDRPDRSGGARPPYDETIATDPSVVVYRISGAFFFGAAASIGSVLDRIADTHRTLIVDVSAVPVVDATAANTLESLARKASRREVRVVLTGASDDVREQLAVYGVTEPLVENAPSIDEALVRVHRAESAKA